MFLCRCSAIWRSMRSNAGSRSSNLFNSLVVVSRLVQILIRRSRLRSFPRIRTIPNPSSSHTQHCAATGISDSTSHHIVLIWSHGHCRLRSVSVRLIVAIRTSSSYRCVGLSWSLLSLKAWWLIPSSRGDITISRSICDSRLASNWRDRVTFSSFSLQVVLLLK